MEVSMNDLAKWIIVGIAILGIVFNTGVLWNDVKHLKKSVSSLWEKMDTIEKFLLERDKK